MFTGRLGVAMKVKESAVTVEVTLTIYDLHIRSCLPGLKVHSLKYTGN